jgi:hypothetical protein
VQRTAAQTVSVAMPAARELPVTCWCEEWIVRVPQRDVVDGITRSCGVRGCVGPHGIAVVGERVKSLGDPWDRGRGNRPRVARQAPEPRPVARVRVLRSAESRKRPGGRSDQVAARRDLVREAYQVFGGGRGTLKRVSESLGVAYQTVVDDVLTLRRRGAL